MILWTCLTWLDQDRHLTGQPSLEVSILVPDHARDVHIMIYSLNKLNLSMYLDKDHLLLWCLYNPFAYRYNEYC